VESYADPQPALTRIHQNFPKESTRRHHVINFEIFYLILPVFILRLSLHFWPQCNARSFNFSHAAGFGAPCVHDNKSAYHIINLNPLCPWQHLELKLNVSEGLTDLGLDVTSGFRRDVQGGSNMTGTDLCVNKPHCAAAVRP